MMSNKHNILFILFFLFVIVAGCNKKAPHPKPRGYFRIALPQKEYIRLDSSLSYSFEYPVYAKPAQDYLTSRHHEWINLYFPQFKGTIHLTYNPLDNNLRDYINDSHEFVHKHIPKASAINTKTYVNDSANVYGLVFQIRGTSTATPFQFYLTDSINHFIRGALYFHTNPNNDSLAPVIDFIEEDITHLVETFQWTDFNESH